jgi:hypothetical protein
LFHTISIADSVSRNLFSKRRGRRKESPAIIKTFRVRRDAEDWARSTEDEIIRGIYVPRYDMARDLCCAHEVSVLGLLKRETVNLTIQSCETIKRSDSKECFYPKRFLT